VEFDLGGMPVSGSMHRMTHKHGWPAWFTGSGVGTARELVVVGVSEGSPGTLLVRWLGELLPEDPSVARLEKGEPSDGHRG
jgi:hypothetical protein